MRRFLTLVLTVVITASCASIPSDPSRSSFSSSPSSDTSKPVYLFEVANYDYDTQVVRFFCGDGSLEIHTMRGLAVGELRKGRTRGRNCGSIRFGSYTSSGGRLIYGSPEIMINDGDVLRIVLTEHPSQTNWGVWGGPRTDDGS